MAAIVCCVFAQKDNSLASAVVLIIRQCSFILMLDPHGGGWHNHRRKWGTAADPAGAGSWFYFVLVEHQTGR
jgi:hypothetical protein